MGVLRFLGAGWAAVHGPGDPRRLLIWTLENRFRGLVPEPAPRSLDWPEIAASAADLPFSFPAVRVSTPLDAKVPTAGLASTREGDVRAAVVAVQQAVATAKDVGTPVVILEPGVVPLVGEVGVEDLGEPNHTWTQDRVDAMLARRKVGLLPALDRVCRVLFDLCRRFPDIRFALTPGRSVRAVGGAEGLEAIFEDLRQCRLAYWHDAAVVARRDQVLREAQGAWLERFSNRCIGMSLGDSSNEGMQLPPGAGGVDYPLLANYLRRAAKDFPACVDLDPAVDRAELPGVHSFLDKFGL